MSKSVTGSSIEGDKNYLQPFQISDVPPVASCVLSEKKKKINLNKRKEEEALADDIPFSTKISLNCSQNSDD